MNARPDVAATRATGQSASSTPDGRRVVGREVHAPSEAVWDVLSDGWFYAAWVVGASRVRDVDSAWPAPRTRIAHSFGIWPAVISDVSEVLECEPGRMLLIKAKGRPVGEAEVRLTIAPGGAERCTVSIVEDAVAGPGRAAPRALRQSVIAPRNAEALRRLALIAEGRHERTAPSPHF